MESKIIIKATRKEMNDFFDNSEVCSVRSFEEISPGTYKARIRHAELSKHLHGVYTIPKIVSKLKGV